MPSLYVVLAFLVGPGLVVNGIFKHGWDRARPKALVEFGMKAPHGTGDSNLAGSHGRSFPSGHASTAFYLSCLGCVAARWGTPKGMAVCLPLGLVWGGLVGWSRIASGAHFLSDMLWSAALVNLVNFLVLLPFMVGCIPSEANAED
ncbi:hypothetical protein AYO49_04335 [Verrucomicrobiaceae bacterium SCGC AG-212-N21]|nr:hypothetical protein AYO49_04335 [Verrucomicrobiaceae bacterium SCGC AG-212-N21]